MNAYIIMEWKKPIAVYTDSVKAYEVLEELNEEGSTKYHITEVPLDEENPIRF